MRNFSARFHDELSLGRRKLRRIFRESTPRILKAGEVMGTLEACDAVVYHFRTGWGYQFRDLPSGRRVIVDVYLPGDVIGLDTVLRARPLEEVLMLTSATVEAIPAEDALMDLLLEPSIALYLAWLLGQHQRRADRLLAAILGLDARGRLATMILDFYSRLRRRRLITGLTYNLPLSQLQIGQYLGLTVVHINRTLQSLRAERLVDLQKHLVTILDLERLRSLARHGGTITSPITGDSSEIVLTSARAAE